ncbi:hypothetical protein TNCV_4314511 [Trichonephila clavipes]|nr:hypothetical protein TNCV_4314511 [Trichonephila clavipes]
MVQIDIECLLMEDNFIFGMHKQSSSFEAGGHGSRMIRRPTKSHKCSTADISGIREHPKRRSRRRRIEKADIDIPVAVDQIVVNRLTEAACHLQL